MNPFFYIILKAETDMSPEESRLYYLAIKILSKEVLYRQTKASTFTDQFSHSNKWNKNTIF